MVGKRRTELLMWVGSCNNDRSSLPKVKHNLLCGIQNGGEILMVGK